MRPLAKLDSLVHHVHSADDNGRVQVHSSAEYTELFRHLEGEFTAGVWRSACNRAPSLRESSGPSGSENDGEEAVWVLGESLHDG